MKYCAVVNDMGFANTNDVLVFSSKKARDSFVEQNDGADAIRVDEATSYATNYSMTQNREIKPQPFSGEYWGIVDLRFEFGADGYIGDLMVCDDDCHMGQRFYA